PAVAVHVRVDIYKDPMAEDAADSRMLLVAQPFEQGGHAVEYLFPGRRDVRRTSYVDGAVAVAGEVVRFQDARLDARAEQGAIPVGMIVFDDRTGVLVVQDLRDAAFNRVECQPVTARGHGIAPLLVRRVVIGVPSAASNALDERLADAIAFDRQRVIGVGDVDLVNSLHVGVGVLRYARRPGKTPDNVFTHALPGRV